MLTGDAIRACVEQGQVFIDPFDPAQLNPNSYNLTLDDYLLVHTDEIMTFNDPDQWTRRSFDTPLLPGEFYLTRTVESAGSDYYVPLIEGRSTAARHGITVHLSAGFGDIGFKSQWTLEVTVAKPIILEPGMLICQIAFLEPHGRVTSKYRGQYASGQVIGGSI